MTILIYEAERAVSGLAEQIQANSKVAYACRLSPWDKPQVEAMRASLNKGATAKGLSTAALLDDDLFYTKSVLVTTNWNRNDDVFSREPVWAARHTPSHKRTNIEHDESQLVGHMTDVWAMDIDGNIIPDTTTVDHLPDAFHLVNGAVIYTNWEADALKERTEKLIAAIQNGSMFVSMEALFSNFAYAVRTPEDKFHVVARNQETAWLTKHLRAYGGSGEYDGCKVGRLLKNIVFCGKGYVENPANPESVIMDIDPSFELGKASTENPFQKTGGVSFVCTTATTNGDMENNMADTVDILKSDLTEARKAIADLQKQLEESRATASAEAIKAFEVQVADLTTQLESATQATEAANTKVTELTEANEGLETQVKELTEAKEAAEAKVAEAEAAKAKADRVSTLVDGGIERETALSKVELFESLSDEQFEAVATELVEANKFKKKDDEKDKDKEKSDASEEDSEGSDDETADAAAEDASEEVLDNAEANEDVAGAAAASEDETADFRAHLQSAVASLMGREGNEEESN